MGKTKRSVILWMLLCVLLTAMTCFSAGIFSKTVFAQAEEVSKIETEVKQIENYENGMTMLLHLSETDYMTATEWSTESNEAYKWVDELAYKDRENHNVCNAILDKNLDAYNYADKILIDGVALKEYSYILMANKYTYVHSLGITFSTSVLASASEIVIKAGCQLPSLTHSYFGEAFVYLETQKDLLFTYKNGSWAKGYPFDGYEAEVEYDACEKYFYLRSGSSYKGHTEAPTFEFTNVFSEKGWGDDGYTLASTADTTEGTLVVADLVHAIDANEFNTVKIRVFSNVPRTFVSYNASKIVAGNLGEALETFSIPGQKFTTISLSSALYADENGKINSFCFQFMDNGSENKELNQFFIGSFSCLDNYCRLTFPLNIQGELTGQETLEQSKVLINGESLEKINRDGNYVEAQWATKDGYYQIDVKLSKAYTGKGAIKNADLSYTGNHIQALKGLLLPNGEQLDRSYTYHIYEGESFIDYELIETYDEIHATDVKVRIDAKSNNNIHFLIIFDKQITKSPYYHACETEEWREESLIVFKGMYDKDVSLAYVSGGFKSSFYDNILINGVSVGEWHAIDDLPTCVHVHYGQTDLYTLDMSIDSYSEMYQPLYEAFEKGEDITIEIKSGMKFTTSTKTTTDYKFVVNGWNATMEKEPEEIKVFYDGKEVNDGDSILSSMKAMESNVFVQGTESYTVTKTIAENTVNFKLTFANGEEFTFSVQEKIINEIPEEESGCSSSIAPKNAVLLLSVLSLFAVFVIRRKRYE